MTPTYLKTSTGPFTVEYIAHADAKAFDLEAGEANACVREADLSLAFRSTHPDFHKVFFPILEELSGVAIKENKKLTDAKRKLAKQPEKVKPIYESFVSYANRAKALVLRQENGETLWAEIEARALAESHKLRIDAKPVERLTPISKADLEKANEWLASGDTEFIEGRVAKFTAYLGEFDLERTADGLPEVESLSRLITAYLKKKKDETLLGD